MTSCTCTQPGFCPALRRHMPHARWKECHEKPAFCELFHREAAAGKYAGAGYRDADPIVTSPALPDQPHNRALCEHRGEELRRQTGELCGCKAPQPVFACAKHGECTLVKVTKGIESCGGACEEYEPREFKRNLIMHVWPISGNGVWQQNAALIRRHRDLFTGKRVIAITRNAYGSLLRVDPPDVVREAFGDGFDFIEFDNDPRLREVVSFVPLLERVESQNNREATFFCHAKGVTHKPDDGSTIARWTQTMFDVLLDWPRVKLALNRHSIVGSFRRFMRFGGSLWHFSGSFYWFRNADVFARHWRRIDRTWFGVESWPGKLFASREAECLVGDRCGDLYQPETWTGLEPELQLWKQSRSLTS